MHVEVGAEFAQAPTKSVGVAGGSCDAIVTPVPVRMIASDPTPAQGSSSATTGP